MANTLISAGINTASEANFRVKQAINLFGRGLLHQQYPNDIEFYFMALEVVDSNLNTVAYFPFPVNPSLYRSSVLPQTTIRNNYGGINVIRREAFIPREIQIAGTFGRRFNVSFPNISEIGNIVSFNAAAINPNKVPSKHQEPLATAKEYSHSIKQNGLQLDVRIKNGYGMCRVLEGLLTQVYSNNSGNGFGRGDNAPYYLILYNSFNNDNYIVEPAGFAFPHTVGQNMMHNYELNLIAVAPLSYLAQDAASKIKRINKTATLEKVASRLAGKVLSSVSGAVVKNFIDREANIFKKPLLANSRLIAYPLSTITGRPVPISDLADFSIF
jgi:hypothetical protein